MRTKAIDDTRQAANTPERGGEEVHTTTHTQGRPADEAEAHRNDEDVSGTATDKRGAQHR